MKPDCFVWVALLDPESRVLELMQAEFDLHPLAAEDARHGHQRPKIEEYGDTISTAISVNLSMIGLQENETVKHLASYGALVTVPTLIAGICGMNFIFMPELQWKYGYVVAIAVMVAVDVYLFYRPRKAKWL